LSIRNKLLLYKSIIKPAWTYVIELWATAASTNIKKLERRVISTGEWSDDRSESALALIILRGMFFVTAKSIRSGTFLGSVGQYVGLAGET